MKRIALVFASLLVVVSTMTSCGNTKECPAYGQVQLDDAVGIA